MKRTEKAEDTVFFYLFSHENYESSRNDSYTTFRAGGKSIYSSEFLNMLNGLDTLRKAFLIESDHSGGWVKDFRSMPYLVMSASDEWHSSWAAGPLPNEGKFSKAFFEHVSVRYCAVDSFYYTKTFVQSPVQNPQIADYSSYVWFI